MFLPLVTSQKTKNLNNLHNNQCLTLDAELTFNQLLKKQLELQCFSHMFGNEFQNNQNFRNLTTPRIKTNPRKWMSFIKDSILISELTIPGTHNSCAVAFKCNVLAKCQNVDLITQLNMGIRFVDIRCCHNMNQFELYHGCFKIYNDFECDVMDVFVNFLNTNPTEIIICSLKPENFSKNGNNSREFWETFLSYASKYKNYWYLCDKIPTMGEVRGKIVLLRRFFSMCLPIGIDMFAWEDNKTFALHNHPNVEFLIQDEHRLMINEKFCAVINFLKHTESLKQGCVWCLNFVSASFWPFQSPFSIACRINKKLNSYLKCLNSNENWTHNKFNLGTIIIDFADSELVKNIFEINYSKNKTILKEFCPLSFNLF